MSVVVEASSSRPRPLSAGLWTLFSWLRRDERSSSSESLSSVGSDRTTASFAFLSPALYSAATPIPLPPPGAPTDSYKKRVQERNQRRKHEHDLTLHRKYGLYRSEGVGYDAFTLPSARNSLSVAVQERERRATSECLRRTAYVPGKRRAPLPPENSPTVRSLSVGPSSSFPRRHSRKRPAPQPPTLSVRIKENKHVTYRDVSCNSDQMNSKTDTNSKCSKDGVKGHKSDNYNKRAKDAKENRKMRSDKSFLKQIFENKKRSSCIEVSTTKLLPNISELDKQAAEIIESCKILEQNNNLGREKSMQIGYRDAESSQNNDSWICVRCLKKYDPAVKICLNCLADSKKLPHSLPAEQKQSTSQSLNIYTQTEKENTNVALSVENKDVDEKLKLKKMLKEMKDSLPNRSKGKKIDDPKNKNSVITDEPASKSTSVDTPTLKIGCTARDDPGTSSHSIPVDSSRNINRSPTAAEGSTAFNDSEQKQNNKLTNKPSVENPKEIAAVSNSNPHKTKSKVAEINIAPLNISSLLNPIYIPKVNTEIVVQQNVSQSRTIVDPVGKLAQSGARASFLTQTSVVKESDLSESSPTQRKLLNIAMGNNAKDENVTPAKDMTKNPISCSSKQGTSSINDKIEIKSSVPVASTSSQVSNKSDILKQLDQHSRRRNLINQLEQSIAKGDENSAAEAAAKLAQLRLSCSVLSFSSQIVGQALSSMQNVAQVQDKKVPSDNTRLEQSPKASSSTQSTNIVPKETQIQLKEKKMINEPASSNANKTQKEISSTTVPKNEVLSVKENIKTPGQKVIQATTSQVSVKENKNNLVPVEIWIEDKKAARGPIKLLVGREATVGDLRREAEVSLGLAARLQRWIIGRELCSDDATSLASLAGAQLRTPFYLYLVESGTSGEKANIIKTGTVAEKTGEVYTELVQLELHPIVPNAEAFECEVCFVECGPGEGVVLRDCVHTFCRQCLGDVVRHSEEPQVSCPALGCGGLLQEREVRALVPTEDYERWLRRGLTAAESGTRDAFHCLTRDCAGWALCEPDVTRFPCPVCKSTNCLRCKAIHEGETCEQHRIKIQEALKSVENNEQDEGTKSLIENLISRGEALECPECKAIITKKWGCDWVKCSACKTEICWVTRGRRWGPAGKGDTSAGCRCGVDGKRCHPSCAYCH